MPNWCVMRAVCSDCAHSTPGVILFDPGAAVTVIRDRDMIAEVHEFQERRTIGGVQLGATGVAVVGQGPMVEPFTNINGLYVPGAAANLLADCDAKHVFNIKRIYNNNTDAYLLTRRDDNNCTLVFACNCDGVFAYRAGDTVDTALPASNAAAFTSYYQQLGLSKDEVKRMLEVHRFHEGAGYMSRDKMIQLVNGNNLSEASITAHDIRRYYDYMHSRACWPCRAGKASAPPQVVADENVVVAHACGECVYIDFVYPTENVGEEARFNEPEATKGSGASKSSATTTSPPTTADSAATTSTATKSTKKRHEKRKNCLAILQAIDDYSGYSMAVQVGSREAKDVHLALCKFIAGS